MPLLVGMGETYHLARQLTDTFWYEHSVVTTIHADRYLMVSQCTEQVKKMETIKMTFIG